jgi:hypothetical protein
MSTERKIALLGSRGSGKTCLLASLLYASSEELSFSTINDTTRKYLMDLADLMRNGDVPPASPVGELKMLEFALAASVGPAADYNMKIKINEFAGELVNQAMTKNDELFEKFKNDLKDTINSSHGIIVVLPAFENDAQLDKDLIFTLDHYLESIIELSSKNNKIKRPIYIMVTKWDLISDISKKDINYEEEQKKALEYINNCHIYSPLKNKIVNLQQKSLLRILPTSSFGQLNKSAHEKPPQGWSNNVKPCFIDKAFISITQEIDDFLIDQAKEDLQGLNDLINIYNIKKGIRYDEINRKINSIKKRRNTMYLTAIAALLITFIIGVYAYDYKTCRDYDFKLSDPSITMEKISEFSKQYYHNIVYFSRSYIIHKTDTKINPYIEPLLNQANSLKNSDPNNADNYPAFKKIKKESEKFIQLFSNSNSVNNLKLIIGDLRKKFDFKVCQYDKNELLSKVNNLINDSGSTNSVAISDAVIKGFESDLKIFQADYEGQDSGNEILARIDKLKERQIIQKDETEFNALISSIEGLDEQTKITEIEKWINENPNNSFIPKAKLIKEKLSENEFKALTADIDTLIKQKSYEEAYIKIKSSINNSNITEDQKIKLRETLENVKNENENKLIDEIENKFKQISTAGDIDNIFKLCNYYMNNEAHSYSKRATVNDYLDKINKLKNGVNIIVELEAIEILKNSVFGQYPTDSITYSLNCYDQITTPDSWFDPDHNNKYSINKQVYSGQMKLSDMSGKGISITITEDNWGHVNQTHSFTFYYDPIKLYSYGKRQFYITDSGANVKLHLKFNSDILK